MRPPSLLDTKNDMSKSIKSCKKISDVGLIGEEKCNLEHTKTHNRVVHSSFENKIGMIGDTI